MGEMAGVGTPLIPSLGLVEGEVLSYLEEHGEATLHGLTRVLDWSTAPIAMAVGAVIREGLVRGIRHDLEVVLEPRRRGGDER